MDILSHTLSGIAIATTVCSIAKCTKKKLAGSICIGALAGSIPDLDAISLWSRFDQSIGKLLQLKHAGSEIYFGKFWYSHHAFNHSMLSALAWGLLLMGMLHLFQTNKKKPKNIKTYFLQNKLTFLVFVCAYNAHLLGDMITPASAWGGVQFFFPHKAYIGGWGLTWWWNNYDIFLLLGIWTSGNLLFIFFWKKWHVLASMFLSASALGSIIILLLTRPVDFSYSGHTQIYKELEAKSIEIQHNNLAPFLFRPMQKLDQQLPIYF